MIDITAKNSLLFSFSLSHTIQFKRIKMIKEKVINCMYMYQHHCTD